MLKGTGIIITNSSTDAISGSWGKFSSGIAPTELGFTDGLIMTTGSATNLNQNRSYHSSVNNGGGSSAELSYMINEAPTFDKCNLEIDFIPLFDTLEIKYVFASEEYNEYFDSGAVDAFAFFVTGINPAGGNYLNRNFATMQFMSYGNPVNIRNINNGRNNTGPYINCELYRNGITGIAYNGLTTILTAKIPVVRNTNYHLQIVIADVKDRYYDSGIFLQAHSLTSPCDTTYYADNYVTICYGETYTINSNTYYEPGTYYDTFVSDLGCDSIVTTYLSYQYIQTYVTNTSQEGNQVNLNNETFGNSFKFTWDFGDGTFAYQSQSDTISHYYNHNEYYTICLSVIDTISTCFNNECINVAVNIDSTSCNAQFYYNSNEDTVFFISYSQGNITNYYWLFETGEVSYEQNPTVVFPTSGYYSTTLRVFNSLTDCFSETQSLVYVGDYTSDCRADFSSLSFQNENKVKFSNESRSDLIHHLI